jgi:hypothetical protein
MNRGVWKGLFIFCILMLVGLAGSLPFLERGSATYIVLQLAAIHIVVAMLLIGTLLYYDVHPFEVFEKVFQ